ncbi:hypothetical protein ACFWBI_21510 [Streptomyces sp. NPDC059982]|uniref:hypothetical protein n=1 Tax=unclassified Streptomyces TaxID=2593676 RepID=UPI00369A205B
MPTTSRCEGAEGFVGGQQQREVVVVDPDCPEDVAAFIRAYAWRYDLTGLRPSFWSPGWWSVRLAATGTGAGLLWWGVTELLEAATGPLGVIYSGMAGVVLLGAAVVTGATVHAGCRLVGLLPAARCYPQARGRCVAAHTLTATGRALLERAQEAVDTILASRIHAADLIDRQANTLTLPAELWSTRPRSPNTRNMRAARPPSTVRTKPWLGSSGG